MPWVEDNSAGKNEGTSDLNKNEEERDELQFPKSFSIEGKEKAQQIQHTTKTWRRQGENGERKKEDKLYVDGKKENRGGNDRGWWLLCS